MEIELQTIDALNGKDINEIMENSKISTHRKNAKLEYKDNVSALKAKYYLNLSGKSQWTIFKLKTSSFISKLFNTQLRNEIKIEKNALKKKYIYEKTLCPENKSELKSEYLLQYKDEKNKILKNKEHYKKDNDLLLQNIRLERDNANKEFSRVELRKLIKQEKIDYKLKLKKIYSNNLVAKENIRKNKYLVSSNGDLFENYTIKITSDEFKQYQKDYKICKVKICKEISDIKKMDISNYEKKIKIIESNQKLAKIKSKFKYSGIFEYEKNQLKIFKYNKIHEEIKKYDDLFLLKKTKYDDLKKQNFDYNGKIKIELKKLRKNSFNNYFSNISNYFKKKETWKSMKNSNKLLWANHLSSRREIKFSNETKQSKHDLKILKFNLKMEIKKENLIYQSSIARISHNIPSTKKPIAKYISLLFGLIIPGAGDIINGQLGKGIIKLFITGVAAMLLLYALGFGNVVGNGIFGLINLGHNDIPWLQKDAKFFLIEGTIGILFLAMVIVYALHSSWSSYKTAYALEKGSRTSTWLETKNYFRTIGYPIGTSIPAIIMVFFVIIVPIITTILLAFTNYNPNNSSNFEWGGFKMFKKIFTVEWMVTMKSVLLWTIIWTVGTWLTTFIIAFVLALTSNGERLKGKVFFRLIYILPWAIPGFITILLFKMMFIPGSILSQLFGSDLFMTDARYAKIAVLMIQMWSGYCVNYVLITGILQSISKDLYEAASIDGANSMQKTWKVTAPLVVYQMTPILIGQFMACFNNFMIIYLYNNGGPISGNLQMGAGATDTLASLIYKLILGRNVAMASALNMIVSVFIVGISVTILTKSKSVKGGIN